MKITSLPVLLLATIGMLAIAHADAPHWTAHYPRFSGTWPAAKTEQTVREFFEGTVIRDARINAATFKDAIPQIRALVHAAGGKWDLGFIIKESDYVGFSKPIQLQAREVSLAGLIDQLAANGNFYWDFSSGKLTLHPEKNP